LNGAVKKTVISMKVEVYELAVLHFIRVLSVGCYSHSIVDGGLELMS
jgi:hypothetical protein